MCSRDKCSTCGTTIRFNSCGQEYKSGHSVYENSYETCSSCKEKRYSTSSSTAELVDEKKKKKCVLS